MEQRLIARGFGVGALSGLLAFVFARIMAEPMVQKAIDYESGRDEALNAVPGGHDPFTRGVQRGIGIGTGEVFFGVLIGGLFAVAFILFARRNQQREKPLDLKVLALLIALGGFLGMYLIPFLKYPANPPAIGHEETIKSRSELFLTLVVVSLAMIGLAVFAARRMAPKLGTWWSTVAAFAGLVAVMAIVMVILPPLGHLDYNVGHYGNQVTETPLPVRGADGTIVYPGFPADVLFKFRLYSVINQVILWGTLGLGFGALAERVLVPARSRVPATVTSAA